MESMGTNHTAVVPVSGFPKAGPPRQVFLAGTLFDTFHNATASPVSKLSGFDGCSR